MIFFTGNKSPTTSRIQSIIDDNLGFDDMVAMGETEDHHGPQEDHLDYDLPPPSPPVQQAKVYFAALSA